MIGLCIDAQKKEARNGKEYGLITLKPKDGKAANYAVFDGKIEFVVGKWYGYETQQSGKYVNITGIKEAKAPEGETEQATLTTSSSTAAKVEMEYDTVQACRDHDGRLKTMLARIVDGEALLNSLGIELASVMDRLKELEAEE